MGAIGKPVLPAATSDLGRATGDLAEHGIAILLDALTAAELQEARAALYRIAAAERRNGTAETSDHGTQRVWNLPSRDPVFCDLLQHPSALHLVRATLGWPARLSNFNANITEPGSGAMMMHADQSPHPGPWSGPQALNIVWCLDEFSEHTGATRVVPGSHRLNRSPGRDGQDTPTVPAEAPAGAMMAMDGRLWHRTGANLSTTQRRAGVFGYYTLPMFMPQENWWLSLDPAVHQFGSDTLKELLGYKVENYYGRVNGQPIG